MTLSLSEWVSETDFWFQLQSLQSLHPLFPFSKYNLIYFEGKSGKAMHRFFVLSIAPSPPVLSKKNVVERVGRLAWHLKSLATKFLPLEGAVGLFFEYSSKRLLAHVYRAADTFNPLMSWVKKMPKPQLNTNSEIFWESYLPGKCNVRCSCKIYRKCPISLHVGWVFQSMDEDENLRVHAEVCHVPISADRGVGSLSGYSLKCPQFLTNASCLSVLFLSHVAITSH